MGIQYISFRNDSLLFRCVCAGLGGTPAETWTSAETLHQLKDFDAPLAELERLKSQHGQEYGNYILHWYDDYDLGWKSNTWAAVAYDDSNWKTVRIPGGFKELGAPDAPSVSNRPVNRM